jgi:hypothetical protein
MPSAEGLIIATGATAFAGNFRESGGFPSNGYGIIGATIALVFIASFTAKGSFNGPIKALAGLMLLGAIYRYIPAFTENKKRTD